MILLVDPKPKTMKQKNFLVAAFALSFLFYGCSKNESSLAASENGPANAAGTTPIHYTTRVTINNAGFNPAEVTVMVSGSILWVNGDNTVHTVTADNGSFDSGDLQPGAAFGFTFNVVGPHYYRCKYHGETTGLVKCVTK
jgi:plastocyanin